MNRNTIVDRISVVLRSDAPDEKELQELLASEVSSEDLHNLLCYLSQTSNDSDSEKKLEMIFRNGEQPSTKCLRSAISMAKNVVPISRDKYNCEKDYLTALERKQKYLRIAALMLKYVKSLDFSPVENQLSLLHSGIVTNDIDIVSRLIELGADVNECSTPLTLKKGEEYQTTMWDGMSPLVMAVYINNGEAVELLQRKGADPNNTYSAKLLSRLILDGESSIPVSLSALSVAVLLGHEEMVELLLEKQPSKENLSTALICAIFAERENILNKLIAAGATFTYDPANKLHVESLYGSALGLKYMQEQGCTPDVKLIQNALLYACKHNKPALAALLKEHGGEITIESLKTAVTAPGADCFRYIRDVVSTPSREELNEMLRDSVTFYHGNCFADLLEMGANPNISKHSWDEEGDSLLSEALSPYSNGTDNKCLSSFIHAVLPMRPLTDNELTRAYAEFIYRGMLDAMQTVHSACGNKAILQECVSESAVMDLVKKGNICFLRFLHESGMNLHPSYMRREAVDCRNIECLKLSFEANPEIPVELKHFTIALDNGFTEAAELMLQHGLEDINSADYYFNPLVSAILHKNEKCTSMLLSAGAKIDIQDYSGTSIVARAAVEADDAATLTYLLQSGLKLTEDDESLFIIAASSGAENCLQLLLSHFNTSLAKSLGCAACYGYPACVQILLDAGADVNEDIKYLYGSNTPILLEACYHKANEIKTGQPRAIELLLKAGANPNCKGNVGSMYFKNVYTPLGAAIINGYPISAVESLISAGADVQTIAATGEQTPLMLAASFGKARVVGMLLKAGADVNTVNANGATALMLAAESGFPQIVKRLMEVGADVQAKDHANKDAFMYALPNGNLRSAEVLLAAGLVPAALSTIPAPYFPMVDEVLEMLRRYNVTEEVIARLLGSLLPAVVSEDKPDVKLIKKLAEYGADVNAPGEKCNTALLVAVANGCSGTIIKAILAAGADPRITDSKGENAVQIAQKSHCAASIITALEKAIAKIEKAEAKAAEKAAKAKEKAAKSAKKKK